MALTASLALALAACSADVGADDADTQDPGVEDVDASTYEPGPLEKMWVDAFGDFSLDDSAAQQARIEQLVAECMAAQGWDYVPVDHAQAGGSAGSVTDGTEPRPGTAEFAAEQGYGITTWLVEQAEDSSPAQGGEASVDPNADYVESLSESAREAYFEALSGPVPSKEEIDAGTWEYDPQDAGCQGTAAEQVYSAGSSPWEDERFTGLMEEMSLMYASIAEDPEVAAATTEWAGCMADAGYPGLTDQLAAQDLIYSELDAVYDANGNPDPARVAPVREKELTIAVLDFECAQSSGLNKVRTDVQHAAEQAFIDTHEAELEALHTAIKEQQELTRQ